MNYINPMQALEERITDLKRKETKMKYPRIEELGLRICEGAIGRPEQDKVRASELEAILEKGVSVKGYYEDDEPLFGIGEDSEMTHSGLLINIQPLKLKPVTRKELLTTLRVGSRGEIDEMADRIEKDGLE